MKEFDRYHPIVILIYFSLIIFFTMFQSHPLYITLSFIISIIFYIRVFSLEELKNKLLFLITIFIMFVIINPLFVHEGVTTLFYLNSNPITLEAVYYGIVFATMLVSTILWFYSFTKLMSNDKITYLFSKTLPTLGLIISMSIRFIPRLQKHLKKIIEIFNFNRDNKKSNLVERIRLMSIVLLSLFTYAFENSFDIASSMKARGYGLANRTNFDLYYLSKRDIIFIIVLIILFLINIIGYYLLNLRFYFYPKLAEVNLGVKEIFVFLSYLLLVSAPIIIEVWEEYRWKLLKSKI